MQGVNYVPNSSLGTKYKFGVIRQDCVEPLLSLNITHYEWIKITFSKMLGYAIIFGATIVKLPQIVTIFVSKSGKGISLSMFYMQL